LVKWFFIDYRGRKKGVVNLATFLYLWQVINTTMKMMKKATKSKATKKVKTGSADTGVPMMEMMTPKGIKKMKPKAGMSKKKY
jgi:hypothetical protein